MSKLNLEVGKEYLTREGERVWILATGLPPGMGGDTVVGIIFAPAGYWDTGTWDAQGKWDSCQSGMDLVLEAPPTEGSSDE